jgi:3alpha(or 20beta)-hydroxysteroid dehydrogenase
MARLTGKVALITGAAGGQGTAEAELFLREEASVVVTDIDTAAGESLAQRLSRQGGKALFLRQDVADEASWKETVAAALAQFGKLHILVNNAGTIARQGIVDTTVDAWNRTLAVNLTGAMLGMKHCAPAIRDSGGGSIINISSTAGLTAHDDAAYTASKWGLRGLTKTAVLQFSQWNIRVNSIHPGQIADTGFYRSGGEAFAHSRPHCDTNEPAGNAQGMCRSRTVPRLRRVELYQRRRDCHRRWLYCGRHCQPP